MCSCERHWDGTAPCTCNCPPDTHARTKPQNLWQRLDVLGTPPTASPSSQDRAPRSGLRPAWSGRVSVYGVVGLLLIGYVLGLAVPMIMMMMETRS